MLLIKSLWITLMMEMRAFFTVMIMKMLSLKTRVGREPYLTMKPESAPQVKG